MKLTTVYCFVLISIFLLHSCSLQKIIPEKEREGKRNIHLIYEADSLSHYILYKGFVVDYNQQKKVPNYTIHRLSPQQLKDSNGYKAERKNRFWSDERIGESSALKSDYYKSGYDRGHHVPAGDFVYSQQLNNESFTYTNISPQYKELNRYGWKNLEAAIRNKVISCDCEAFVITGTVFKKDLTIGKGEVGVPDELYKIAFYPAIRKMYAFRMRNDTTYYKSPLKNYQVSVDFIEWLVGGDFFELLEDKVEERLEKKKMKFNE